MSKSKSGKHTPDQEIVSRLLKEANDVVAEIREEHRTVEALARKTGLIK